MSRSRSSQWMVLAALSALALGACAKHNGVLAPSPITPVVFDDSFGDAVDWQSFDPAGGAKVDALSIDTGVAHSGSRSIRITVPAAGDPSGTYAGGAFTTGLRRDLSSYDALTFWAKADRSVTFNELGLGNDNTGTSKYVATLKNVPMGTDWQKYVIPIPLPSRLRNEGGLFFLAEGSEAGAGATVWFDEIQFERLGTITNPRPRMTPATLTPDVGSEVAAPGTRVTFAVAGVDVTLEASQGYFTFSSDAEAVVTGGEGVVRVVGLGTAKVSARLGSVPLPDTLTITPKPAPLAAAPAPTLPAADVISLFSNAYTNRAVDTWSATWDVADVADAQVGGNDTKKYTNLSYAGIEFTGTRVIDATSMTHFHIDAWAAAGTTFRVKLVDFGANGVFGPLGPSNDDRAHELTFTPATTPALSLLAWSSFDIPLSSFLGLTTRGHLAQLIISGDVGTVYVDNVYFHK